MTFHVYQLLGHATQCAALEFCITSEVAAATFSCSAEDARAGLKMEGALGLFRAVSTPGLGNKITYQPTAKALGLTGAAVPKFLRSGLSAAASLRGLLRAAAYLQHPQLTFLSAAEQSALCQKNGIPERGHARALLGQRDDHLHIFIPLLASEKPAAAIEAAASRWLLLLDAGRATLQPICRSVDAPRVREVLAALAPQPGAREQLAALDSEIEADQTGLAALRLASRRAALAAVAEAERGDAGCVNWIGEIVEAAL